MKHQKGDKASLFTFSVVSRGSCKNRETGAQGIHFERQDKIFYHSEPHIKITIL
jgi:hypothetical protein